MLTYDRKTFGGTNSTICTIVRTEQVSSTCILDAEGIKGCIFDQKAKFDFLR
jgi:hypothetical protein